MRNLLTVGATAVVSFLISNSATAASLPATPVAFTSSAGANSSVQITFSGITQPFDITNAMYLGWYSFDPTEPSVTTGLIINPLEQMPLPPFDSFDWNRINYVLNNKLGSPQDVQAALLFFTTGVAPNPALFPEAVQMIANAQANGADFVPEVTDVTALLLEWAAPSENTTIVESPPTTIEGTDRFTAGGFIVRNGIKCNFALRGGLHNGGFWGGLNYMDRGAGIQVRGRGCTGYFVIDTNCRRVTYDVTINGAPGTATVTVCDNGEPGRTDTVQISLSTGYTAGSNLGGPNKGGGNVQLHKAKPAKGGRNSVSR